jgi:phosphoribosylformylglycinamidine (FGAM) synthase PurS component
LGQAFGNAINSKTGEGVSKPDVRMRKSFTVNIDNDDQLEAGEVVEKVLFWR